MDDYTSSFGKTSAAAAHVAGIAALIRSVNPGLSWSDVRTVIRNTADKIDDIIYPSDQMGYGRINAYEAVKEAISLKQTTNITSNTTWNSFVLVPNPNDPASTFNLYVENGATLTIASGAVVAIEEKVRLTARNNGTIKCEPGAKIILESTAEIVAGDDGECQDNGATIVFQGNQACLSTNGGTLKFTSGLTRTVDNGGWIAGFASGGAIEFGDNAELVLEDGALFKVEQGTTLKLGDNVDITVASDARATIEGTASQPVTFTSLDGTPNRGDWGTVTLAGDSNTVEYTTVEGGDWGLKFYGNPSASSGNVVKNSTLRKNDPWA